MVNKAAVQRYQILCQVRPNEVILDHSSSHKKQLEDHIFRRLVYCQKLLLSHIKDSPLQRYEALLSQRPDVIKRVPQHYIASFLGVSKVHLSRIKSQLARNS